MAGENNNSFVELPNTGYVQPRELGSSEISLGLFWNFPWALRYFPKSQVCSVKSDM